MHRLVLIAAMIGILDSGTVQAAEPGQPRALIEKALRAQGGKEKLASLVATQSRVKGLIHEPEGIKFTGETFEEPGRHKQVLQFQVEGTTMTLVQVVDGANAWCTINGQAEPLDEKTLKEMKQGQYAEHVTNLFPLLEEKGYALSILGESKVEDRVVTGVKVASEGHPAINLYFDQASGLLLKREYRGIDQSLGSDVLLASTFSAYREFDPAAADEETLKAAQVATSGPELLDYLRGHTLAEADQGKMETLVQQLGAESFRQREKASAQLVARGAAAVPFLRKATNSSDLEVARRARQCLQQIKQGPVSAVPAAVVRLVGLRKPSGAAEVLLAYLPSAPDQAVDGDVRTALAAVAFQDGKPDKALSEALRARDPVQRQAAVEALGQAPSSNRPRRLVVTGVKMPMKITQYHDGKKALEYEILETNLFTRFEDSLFAKP
jgi:hypothetical protein